jgi:hypothetical protein
MPSVPLQFKHLCLSLHTENIESCGDKEDAVAQQQDSNRSIEVRQFGSVG